jgi:hypothetical protein
LPLGKLHCEATSLLANGEHRRPHKATFAHKLHSNRKISISRLREARMVVRTADRVWFRALRGCEATINR